MARNKRRNGYVVASAVRAFLRKRRCCAGSDLFERMNQEVEAVLASAVKRTLSNKRKTVRACDV